MPTYWHRQAAGSFACGCRVDRQVHVVWLAAECG
jgi:hypothetical protein